MLRRVFHWSPTETILFFIFIYVYIYIYIYILCWFLSLLQVNYVLKGMNPLTEHFSVFKAEMPLENDQETQLNLKLIEELQSFDAVLVCGQALTHCVNRSCRDLVLNWEKRTADIALITDCTSAIPGFENMADEFLSFMKESGCKLQTTRDWLS